MAELDVYDNDGDEILIYDEDGFHVPRQKPIHSADQLPWGVLADLSLI
jgi:hypothetical protein